jgi:hypothetical protein
VSDRLDQWTETARGLMRGNPATFHLGYSIGNALIAVAEMHALDATEVAVLAEKVVDTTTEHSSPTKRPLVVAVCEGGVVHEEILLPGLGTPEFTVLDFDTEGMDDEELTGFIELVESTVKQLTARGGSLPSSYWLDKIDGLKAQANWPVDHAEGEA